MSLTPESVLSVIQRRMDGMPSTPAIILCNQAGAFIASSYEWSWLTKKAHVRLPANQDRIRLPVDLARIMPPIEPMNGDLLGTFNLLTLAEVLRFRNSSILGTSYARFGAISYISSQEGVPEVVLEVFPSAGDDDVEYEFFYRARWTNVETDSQRLPMPPWPELEGIFLDVATAYARSYDEHDIASRSAMLAEIRLGPEWVAAVHLDGSIQSDYGRLRGGALYEASERMPEMERVIPGGPLDLA